PRHWSVLISTTFGYGTGHLSCSRPGVPAVGSGGLVQRPGSAGPVHESGSSAHGHYPRTCCHHTPAPDFTREPSCAVAGWPSTITTAAPTPHCHSIARPAGSHPAPT